MVTIERLDSPKEEVGSDAFRIEYEPNTSENVLIDDVISYLGEYRFNLPKYSYAFKFSDGKLRDPHRNDSMEELSQRAIDRKVKEGISSVRERAEKKGFQSLNIQLASSKTGDTIIWASPPGPREEGYGDYGFLYFGKVESNNLEEKSIKMIAIRVENPKIEQFRKAIYMLTGEDIDFESAKKFLNSPRVVREDIKEGYVDAILKRVFNFKPNEKEQKKFRQIVNKRMFSLIYDFARNPLRTRKDLYALENYALELKEHDGRFVDLTLPSKVKDIVWAYGHEPPKVAGSCGSTGNTTSNIFNKGLDLNNLFLDDDKYGSRSFECPSCGKTNIRPEDKLISNCQHCGRDVAC